MILGSVAVGMMVGFVGLSVMKTTKNRIAEMMVLIITGYGAFELSEHFFVLLNFLGAHSHLHLSGILSCIFATITVNHLMTQAITEENNQLDRVEAELKLEAQLRNSFIRRYRKCIAPNQGYR